MPRPPVRLASFDTHLECPVFNATFPYHVAMLRGQKLQSHHKQKVVAFRQFAEHVARTDGPDQLVVLFDSRDVMFTGCEEGESPASTFAALQRELGVGVLFGAEFGCHPMSGSEPSPCSKLPYLFPDRSNLTARAILEHVDVDFTCTPKGARPGYRFLNAGLIAGKAGSLRDFYAAALNLFDIADDLRSDQALMTHAFLTLREAHRVEMDYGARFVLSLQRIRRSGMEQRAGGRVFSNLFGRAPCFMHGNGNGKQWMGKLLPLGMKRVSKKTTAEACSPAAPGNRSRLVGVNK